MGQAELFGMPRAARARREPKAPVVRRPFTERELRICKALEHVSMPPATSQKRFARQIAFVAANNPQIGITEKQAGYLRQLAWRFRRQMPADLVEAV